MTDAPVRVALFTNNYLPFCGGVTTSVETLRRGLAARGHEPWVFAPRFPDAPLDGPHTVRYPSLPAATYPQFALAVPISRRVARVMDAVTFDAFHAHHPFLLGPAARRYARRQRRPLVFTYHTRYEKYAHYVPFRRSVVEAAAVRLSTRFAARADAVIAPSAVIRDELRARGVGTPIAVIPTGVDLEAFSPGAPLEARVELGLPVGDLVLLYVGRLDREKSVDRILLAFERIATVVPRARLVLVGQGTEGPRLRRLAQGLPARARVTFLGARPHDALPACYRAADLFLFASETETQGLVLAEAAACGLPAVAVGAAGSDEVVRDGHTGLLTKGDPAALAEAAIGLLVDPERRAAMGRHARHIAEREFDLELQVERTLAVYADAAARLRARSGA
ncbi:MAG: glycosyltransferase [Candidatus Rokubacteria bacterium]|nr:glycosyltransferase [Candidatus Rokubacteria bacterium]